ncbi:16S rRNA (guanine(527)-N(7))-methyltransferase RsmG [Antarcticirhabdus aurantiaca]|uniref:16S rRNA (Guanine(527)-N(7))-methyltransferase RsmG n=1 Tax=Antarcticirhabdus aurantiaca TaxID=2606717 RepID=A0ACD4NPN3_9HYPH|nr:16S rRNA (guanine(527)-N(7))-methyltransferase RsmG [Jeongeuplla avenae]
MRREAGNARGRDTRTAPRQTKRVARPSKSLIAATQAEEREAVLQRFSVSRETAEKLDAYAALLQRWQAAINLVSPASLPHLWTRHIGDSLALHAVAPGPLRWTDIGSGGGLPGLVLAICNRTREGARVDLVESNNKKAAFLREAARELGLPVAVHAVRIEEAGAVIAGAEAVSARALASLDVLLGFVAPHLSPNAACFFPKGESFEAEIAQASAQWRFDMVKHPSTTGGEDAAILEIRNVARL